MLGHLINQIQINNNSLISCIKNEYVILFNYYLIRLLFKLFLQNLKKIKFQNDKWMTLTGLNTQWVEVM